MASGGLPVSGGILGLPALRRPGRHLVRMRTIDRKITVTAMLDDGEWQYTPEAPRVDTIDLPWRPQGTAWTGQTTATLQGQIIIDGWPKTSIEDTIDDLESMARPVREGRASGAPKTLQIAGSVPGTYELWWLTGIEYTKTHRRGNVRVRVHATLSFTKSEPLESAETKRRRNSRTNRGNRKPREPYTVRKNDTLVRIAAAELGDSKRWKDIAKLNPRKNGKKSVPRRRPDDVRVGEKLKMPAD